MVYREVEVRAPEPTSDVLLRIDASGAAGAHARDGHSGADGGGGGAHGAPGGHAGAAGAGGHAGRVEVTLAGVGSSVEITGMRRGHAERERHAIREQREIGEQGFLDLVARGGAGGHGGRGGDGGAGARGRSGSDATRWSHGGNGGRGGDGGAGGHGTSGRDGGPGGAVVVRVRDEDTHLLMLVRHGIEGGAGGRAGRHGAGGAAGSGGAGGASHSWTTTESYRDSQGKTQTRTRFHSNPGGSSGPSGHPGPSGHGPLYDGASGPDGAFVIEVERAGGTEHFAERYHLVLAGLEIHTPDADGVTEPGERVELRRVRVTNVGGMPMPRHRDVRVEAVESSWVRPIEGAALLAPRGLAAGATAELEGILPFELRDYATTAGSDPLTEREPLVLDGRVPDVSRSFDGFLPAALEQARTLTVRFPVAASVLEALPSLAPGEVSRLRFAIRNVSRSAVGASSPGRRRLRVRLHLHESELDDRHVVLFDEHGLPQLLGGDGLVRELDLLEPGADFVFEGALGVVDDAPTYRALRVRLTLELGRLETPDLLRVVQHRELELRVAEHVGERDFDWLLVTHHRTTREEVDAWRALAERQGQRLAIFDLSLHGDLGLERPFEGGASLLARARGGLVILLGYPMSTPAGDRAPTSFLGTGLLASMSEQRADLLVVGGEGSLRDWVAPEGLVLDPDAAPLEGSDALIEHLGRLRDRSKAPEHGPDRDGAEVAVRVRVDEIVFGLEAPDEERLIHRAQALAERLARLFPEREHEVVHELDPDLTPSWAPVRRRRLGWLRVLSRAAGRSGLAHLALEPERARDPSTIAGAEVATATLLARGVDDRVRALAETLSVERPDTTLATALADALLVSIACEQLAVLRRTRARSGLSRESLSRALGALSTLSETRLLGAHEVGSHAGATLARLVARARFFARAQASLWERIPGLAWSRRAGVLVSLTDELTRAFLARQSGSDDVVRQLEDRARVELEALDQGWRAARAGGLRDPAAYARALLLAPTWSTSFTVEEELVLAHEPRAIAASDWAATRATSLGARAAVHATEEGLDALRARLLVPERTRDLLEASEDDPASRAASPSRLQAS